MKFDVPLADALAFATQWVEENPDLFTNKATQAINRVNTEVSLASVTSGIEGGRSQVQRVPVVGSDGLTEAQRAAVGNVGLCPNCQQPNTDHLPGCARRSGEAPRAVTSGPLPPVQ